MILICIELNLNEHQTQGFLAEHELAEFFISPLTRARTKIFSRRNAQTKTSTEEFIANESEDLWSVVTPSNLLTTHSTCTAASMPMPTTTMKCGGSR
jgi:hypothetical protein